MRELAIDPVTKDFVSDGRGSLALSAGAETAVLHALEILLGEDWYLPGDGSKLNDAQAFSGATDDMFAAELRRALAVLEQRGRISDVHVVVTSSRPSRRDVTIYYTDAQSGRAITVQR